MAHKIIDRCKETTSTTGTGTLTLTGAVSGFAAMADATIGLTTNGDTSWFCAENGSEWEVFLGTRSDATHLARTTVLASSNSGSAVSFTAAPTVFSTVPGAKLSATAGPAFDAYRDTSNQSITNNTLTKVEFNAENFDTGACFDSTTNHRFTPNVAGYYDVEWLVKCFSSTASIVYASAALYKNGVEASVPEYEGGACSVISSGGSKLVYMNGTTDYLEVFVYITGTTPLVVSSPYLSYFCGHLARPA